MLWAPAALRLPDWGSRGFRRKRWGSIQTIHSNHPGVQMTGIKHGARVVGADENGINSSLQIEAGECGARWMWQYSPPSGGEYGQPVVSYFCRYGPHSLQSRHKPPQILNQSRLIATCR